MPYFSRARTLALGRINLSRILILGVSGRRVEILSKTEFGAFCKKGSKPLAIFAKNPSSLFDKLLNTPLNLMIKLTVHKKRSFPLRISSINMTKSAGNCRNLLRIWLL